MYISKYTIPKKEYIEGYKNAKGEVIFPTLEQLSEKNNIKIKTIQKRCAKEGWVRLREEFQAEAELKAKELAATKRALDIVKLNSDCQKLAETAIWEIQRHQQASVLLSGGDPTKGYPMPLADIEAIARAAERLQRIACLALGIPVTHTAISGPDGGPIQQETQIVLTLEERKKMLDDIKERTQALLEDVSGGSIPKT